MIRRGKAAGSLCLPPDRLTETLSTWARWNNITFDRTVLGHIDGKGGALLAKERLEADRANVLLTVPKDLILSLDRVHEHAKADRDLREILEALGEAARTPRGAILSFLLVQISALCRDRSDSDGVLSIHTPFTEYIKSLPLEDLPIFWSLDERDMLYGTTLLPAMTNKLKGMKREYDAFCSAVQSTRWYQLVGDQLGFDDWKQVDAMYRSRALDYPGIGHCMVPCIDMANHASRGDTVAIYEVDADGDAVLLLREGKQVPEGGEVTISYGDDKGACEMLYSYGFLGDDMDSARNIFLSLSVPEDDELKKGKEAIAGCAPGVKLLDTGVGRVDFTGDFIWLLCINGEDGLRFDLAQTVDGKEEMHALLDDHEITGGAAELRSLLRKSDLRDVYKLRSFVRLQERIFDQLAMLNDENEDIEDIPHGVGTDISDSKHSNILRLRSLEFDLLTQAYDFYQDEIKELAQRPEVTRYLARMNGDE